MVFNDIKNIKIIISFYIISRFFFKKLMLLFLREEINVWFKFRGLFSKLISILKLLLESIILSSRWKVSINDVNLPLPLFEFINVIKDLLI